MTHICNGSRVVIRQNVVIGGGIPYQGEYRVTPSQSVQVLQTSGRALKQDVVIEAIPQNYGKIGWDGQKLTVS